MQETDVKDGLLTDEAETQTDGFEFKWKDHHAKKKINKNIEKPLTESDKLKHLLS